MFHTQFAILSCFLKRFRKETLSLEGSFKRLAQELKRNQCLSKKAESIFYELSGFVDIINEAITADLLREYLKLGSIDDFHNCSFKSQKEAQDVFDCIIKEFFPFFKFTDPDLENLPKFYPLNRYVKAEFVEKVENINPTENDKVDEYEQMDVDISADDHNYSKNVSQNDYLQSYYQNMFALSSIFCIFSEAIKEGDGITIFLLHKMLLRIFHNLGSKNYAKMTANYIANIMSLNLPSESFRLLHNRFGNRCGGKGRCTAKDFNMEHRIRFLKRSMTHLGANLNRTTIKRINDSSDKVEEIIKKLREDCKVKSRASKRTEKTLFADFLRLTNTFRHLKIAKTTPNRGFWRI